MPAGRGMSILRRILAERGKEDAVVKRQAAKLDGLEKNWSFIFGGIEDGAGKRFLLWSKVGDVGSGLIDDEFLRDGFGRCF